eukprot:2354239-Pyramimonas_sp.AAC.1
MAGGPTWNTVERRTTYDMDSGAVIRAEDVKGVTNKEILYVRIPGGPRDITTISYYRQPSTSPAGVARSLVLIDSVGYDVGRVNPANRKLTPSVAMPTMPRGPDYAQAHKEKLLAPSWARPALVTRNLNKRDVAAEPRAQEALRKEHERLEKKQTWMIETVAEKKKTLRQMRFALGRKFTSSTFWSSHL